MGYHGVQTFDDLAFCFGEHVALTARWSFFERIGGGLELSYGLVQDYQSLSNCGHVWAPFSSRFLFGLLGRYQVGGFLVKQAVGLCNNNAQKS